MSSPASPVDPPSGGEYIKRPCNAWVLYRRVKKNEFKLDDPDEKYDIAKVSKFVSELWANEPKEVKLHYEHLADEEKMKHLQLHPDYKYRPGLKHKGKKPRTVKQGGVKKSRSKKAKTTLASAINHVHIQPASMAGGQWPGAIGLAPAPNGVVGLDSAVSSPNDQYPVSDSVSIFSPDTYNTSMFDGEAQPMAYYGQPHAGPIYVAMPPPEESQVNAVGLGAYQVNAYKPTTELGASQVNTYQPTSELSAQIPEWYTNVYSNQLYAGDGLVQSFDLSGANQQMTGLDVAAYPSATYANAYSQNEGGWESSADVMYPTPNVTHANLTGDEHAYPGTIVDAIGAQGSSSAVNQVLDFNFLPVASEPLYSTSDDVYNPWGAGHANQWVQV